MGLTNTYIDTHAAAYTTAIDFLKKELSELRTGRATSALVEHVSVLAYDTPTPLGQLASISVPEAQSISIEPWDKNLLKAIEKALTTGSSGLSVINTGIKLIAKVPPLTEETRKEMIKLMGDKVEQARIRVRQVRDTVKEEITEAEKNKEITEDDKYLYYTQLDNYTSEINRKMEEMEKEKEGELMKI